MPGRESQPARGGGGVALVILAIALAYTEASVVVYLREALEPLRRRHFPHAAREVVPLLTVEQLRQAGDPFARLLVYEVAREMTPLIVLLAMAWAVGRRRGKTVACFLVGFGVWDVFYYVFLKLLLGWPASLGTWDVLFLIPTAWVAPVWAPLVVAVTLAATGTAMLASPGGAAARHDRFAAVGGGGRLSAGLAIVGGTGLVLTSFFLRTGEALGGVPQRFDWQCFLAGWLLAAAGIAWLLRRRRRRG